MKNWRTVMLKVKAKSLAEEARIIRKEERKLPGNDWRRGALMAHRIGTVRSEARATQIAYGLLRGRSYEQVEPRVREDNPPDWTKVKRMVARYKDPSFVVVYPNEARAG